jgi:hypothetical protein
MSDYIVTQQDVEILLQPTKVITYKLELLNSNMRVIERLEGNLISDNISIDSQSDIRRTYECQLVVTDSSFDISKDSKIWFDKLIRPYIGIKHQRSQQVVWYCLGTFLFTDMNYNYDSITQTLSLTCQDMMCLLNDTRKGVLDQYKRNIEAGSDVREVIISLLNELGITKYFIEFNINGASVSTYELPYDLTYEAGMTVYTILKDLVEMYPGTQMYFDLYGVFNIRRIPTKSEEQNILTDDILNQIVVSENLSTSFSNIYNKVIIWGKVNEPDYYTKDVSISDNVYNVSLVYAKLDDDTGATTDVQYDEYQNFDIIALRIPSTNLNEPKIKINSLEEISIVNDSGNNLTENYLEAGKDYVFRYRKATNDFLILGQYQCYGESYLTNNVNDKSEYAVIDEDNDLSIEHIGIITKVLSGDEFDNLYTDQLCLERCRYELYNNTNMQSTLNIEMLAVPFLDVNQKIKYTSKIAGQECEYLISQISCDYSQFTMSLYLNRFYPDYI